MISQQSTSNNSPIISCFLPSDDLSLNKEFPIVYHYTSTDSFLSIISSKAVRFSDIRYMNDKSETVYFAKLLIEFVDKRQDDYPFFCEVVNNLLDGNNYNDIRQMRTNHLIFNDSPKSQNDDQRHFIFCCSSESDSLNMWNYYVSNGRYQGYNIGFNVKNLLKTFDTYDIHKRDIFSVVYGQVIYKRKQQDLEIEKLAKQFENEKSMYNSLKKNSMYLATLVLQKYFVTKGNFYKDDKFKSESEYRIVISVNKNDVSSVKNEDSFGKCNKEMCEGFTTKNGLVVPYLNVTLPLNCIANIKVSPITEFDIAKSSVKELLSQNGFKNDKQGKSVTVLQSKIPIRF